MIYLKLQESMQRQKTVKEQSARRLVAQEHAYINIYIYVYIYVCVYTVYVYLVYTHECKHVRIYKHVYIFDICASSKPPSENCIKARFLHDMRSFSRFSIAVELCKENLSLLLLQKRAVKRKYQSML